MHALASPLLNRRQACIILIHAMSNIARTRSRSEGYTCLCCGDYVDCGDYNPMSPIPKIMEAAHLCFSCAFWTDKANNPLPGQQIIDGKCYAFKPWGRKSKQRSCYLRLSDGTAIRSNSFVDYGTVPKRFMSILPDTAKFITKQAYHRISAHPYFKCKSKGCWDRYHCFWYDMTLEGNKPWNVIPKNHRVGDECCESFLNKNKVYE